MTMAKMLTARSVERFTPDPKKRREISDGGSGLYFIIQPSGVRSWAVRYRHQGKPRKFTIGPYPLYSLPEARREAREALEKVDEGINPSEEKKRARQEADSEHNLFSTITEEFLIRHVHVNSRPNYAQQTESILRKDVLPKWGERKIQDITKRDVIELLDGIVDAGRGLTANRTLAMVRKLFNWSIERGIIETSPCQGVKAPLAERARDRVLTDDEIRWLWRACIADGYPFGPLVQLLLLTGARRTEVAGMTSDEVDIDECIWTIPGTRTKNGEEHVIPFSDAAVAVINALPRIMPKRGAPNYLFTTNAETHVSGYSRSKARLDGLMLAEAREEIPRWTLHDLRRTVASGMARLGIALPVTEKVLNHTSGSFAGIVAVYQRHEFADEKRHALEAWGKHVIAIVDGETTNVVEFLA